MIKLVVSPETFVRYKQGAILVCTGKQFISTDNPVVFLILSFFSKPQYYDDTCQLFEHFGRQQVEKVIYSLQAIGALIERHDDAKQTERILKEEVEGAPLYLSELANRLCLLSGDITAFGSYGHEHILANTGISVGTRLQTLLASVDALQTELSDLRGEYVRQQLDALGAKIKDKGLKLHIGAGNTPLESWINIDAYFADLTIDVRWELPFPDQSVDYVFMSHILEHVYYPDEAAQVLKDINRVLTSKGVVRVVVPDIEKCINAYVQNDKQFFEKRKEKWSWWPDVRTNLEGFLAYAGAGPSPASFLHSHKFGYDFETLSQLLTDVGFHEVEKSEYMSSRRPELRVDHASGVAAEKYGDKYYSLFVEASKQALW
jgi:SAM-dependent methyltransferase